MKFRISSLTLLIFNFLIIKYNVLYSNTLQDTTKEKLLETITVTEKYSLGGVQHYQHSKDLVIFAAKKNEILRPQASTADLSSNNMRQIYAKIPGITIWESDASGIQTNIASRGLSPNRSWEFNIRQNGVDVCSEIFGYPEAYFTPPVEAVEQIEVIRGAASLQFGPQFGGLVNYRIKSAKEGKKWQMESQQTLGSYGLFNSYNSLGGDLGKFKWFSYYHRRSADSWRPNNQYNIHTGYISMEYQPNDRWKMSMDYTAMDYTSQQAGGLTDQMFKENHRQSVRSRNWMSTPWNTGQVNLEYRIHSRSTVQLKTFITHSFRNSIGFIRPFPSQDTILGATLSYDNRQVDKDQYNNIGSELRSLTNYNLFNKTHQLAIGARSYKGRTTRSQLGVGSTGSDPDFQVEGNVFARNLKFGTLNHSLFAENIFYLHKRWKLIPGIRWENIQNTVEGRINATDSAVFDQRGRNIVLAGLGVEFKINELTNVYANISNAYRPVTFSELTPSATSDVIDPHLKDANGYNSDLGIRGTIGKWMSFDFSLYYLKYNDRIGNLNKDGKIFRTNIGSSESFGVESYFEIDLVKLIFMQSQLPHSVKIFSSTSLNRSRYTDWNNPAIAQDPSKSIQGKKVEFAPEYIHRVGIQLEYKMIQCSFQSNYVGGVYTDAANTFESNASGTIGFIPSYAVHDANFSLKLSKFLNLRAGINNLLDAKYATRRAGGYPGPGLLPAQGRTFFAGIGIQFEK
ncbi:MAG: TonB-dependent receptor [Saprospiraceae bacterium]|nr:TonB-dependent receptor [Saprospiraceae bacterium]